MHRWVRLALVVAAASLLIVVPVTADDETGGSSSPSVGDLLERIERLEVDKASMQGEIDELRTRLSNDSLTEQRADEIRSLVADVLADADVRSNLLQDGLTAGWDEHFFLGSADGRFRLQLEGQLQVRYVWSFHDQPDRFKHGFENTRNKLTFRGHMFGRDLTYLLRGDFNRSGGAFSLQDSWVRYQLSNEFSLRVGQFKLPFNREELVASSRQLAVERSLVNESLNIGRSQGIELTYADQTSRVSFAVSDAGTDNVGGFGLVGTLPQNSPSLVAGLAEWAVTARYETLIAGTWGQFEDFTSPVDESFALLVGLAGHAQENEFGTGFGSARNEDRWAAFTVDASAEWGGANAFGAVTYHYIDDVNLGAINVMGVVVQGGAYFTQKFEAYARFEYGFFDVGVVDFSDLYLVTFGGNYYYDGQASPRSSPPGTVIWRAGARTPTTWSRRSSSACSCNCCSRAGLIAP
ncbi:MAG: porin [Planctomycetota bacterium]|jgi:hypothetical protein